MRPAQLVLRNLVQHRVSALLTALNVGLGLFLVGVVLLLRSATDAGLIEGSRGYSLVLGPPGSSLELVLNSVFHQSRSAGLLPSSSFTSVAEHPSTELAVPLALGDTFRGYRVVATTPAAFDPRVPLPKADSVEGKLSAGRIFRHSSAQLARLLSPNAEASTGVETIREAVVGARVARELGLRVGDQLEPSHGSESGTAPHQGQHLWTVVGIVRETLTAIDGLVWINLESFLALSEHAGGVIAESGERGISSVWVFPRGGVHKLLLLAELNKQSQVQVADIPTEVAGLLKLVGRANQLLLLVAFLVVAVGVCSVGLGVYASVNARRRELAVLRVLGAGRKTVLALVVAEATLLSAGGGMIGLLCAHAAVAVTARRIAVEFSVHPVAWQISTGELLALGAVVLAGALGGLWPASQVYRQDAVAGLRSVV